MKSLNLVPQIAARRCGVSSALSVCAAAALLGSASPARANLIIDAAFDSSITGSPNAASIEGAINSADAVLEAAISTPITVPIYYESMNSGLGESTTHIYSESYYDYYNALKAVATGPGGSAAQLTALASLGTAPTSASSGNPVNGSTIVQGPGPSFRALGFNTPPAVVPPAGGNYDGIVGLNTSITSPPNGLSGNYSLEAVALHETDEVLGIGGTGSNIGNGSAVRALDLYRYTAPGVRSFSSVQTSSPFAYFSINGGSTVLSYFSQTAGSDYGDWLSNPIPSGFDPQVQDAFGTPGSDPTLGPNELTGLNVVGYELTTAQNQVPEPMSLAILLPGALSLIAVRRRPRKARLG
jgi:hypothetical protein